MPGRLDTVLSAHSHSLASVRFLPQTRTPLRVGAKCGRPHRGSNRALTTGTSVWFQRFRPLGHGGDKPFFHSFFRSFVHSFAPKAWKNGESPERCPVECYKRFVGHRPQEMMDDNSPFYLAVKHNRRSDDPIWFCKGPLGKNSLSHIMKSGCEKAGISGRKTNHSARKTCVKRALDAGCPREYVAQLTGHISVASLENYAEADIQVQRAMCGSVMRGVRFNAASTSAQWRRGPV